MYGGVGAVGGVITSLVPGGGGHPRPALPRPRAKEAELENFEKNFENSSKRVNSGQLNRSVLHATGGTAGLGGERWARAEWPTDRTEFLSVLDACDSPHHLFPVLP